MTKEQALDAVEKAINKAFDKGKELAIHDVRDMLQCCYNYIRNQKDSDFKKHLIEELEKIGCV